jgi:hypothetical protein
MDYDSYEYSRRRPQTLLQRHPLGGRVVVLVGFFALLVPILRVFSGEKAAKVQTTGLEDVALMTPIVTQPPSTLPPTVVITEIATLPAPVPTAATVPAVAIEALPPAVIPQVAAVTQGAPVSKKTTTTFDIQSLPDAVPVNPPAPAPAAKPVATTAKPAVTTAKPVATTAKPAPKSTAPAAKPTPTTAKPAPTTTAKPNRQYSTEEVKSLIRQMWPADSVDKALDVAWKESNYLAGADNGICCLGVFQINFSSHQRRLAARGLGRNGLFDARANIEIALEIFREQGWSPWTTA